MSTNTFNLILILPLFVLISVNLVTCEANAGGQETVRLNMMHRHHPTIVERLKTDMNAEDMNDRMKDIHMHDSTRHRMLTALRLRKLPETKVQGLSTTELPAPFATGIGLKMFSGSDYGTSEYFVEMKIGTPPQKHVLIVDTGSDLMWVKCRYRRCIGANCNHGSAAHKSRNEHRAKLGRVFYANRSSSFATVPCGSNECAVDFTHFFVLRDCKLPTDPCCYDYSYAGGASARGLFAVDTLTVNLTDGTEKQLNDSVIGCTESVSGSIFKGADGVVGLGANVFSFTYKAGQNFQGGGFSYCLVDHLTNRQATSYFIIGPPSPASRAAATTAAATGATGKTTLLVSDTFRGLYGTALNGISIDGVMLDIPPKVWDINSSGGTILDTGTSLTMLTMPAYEMVLESFLSKMPKLPRLKFEAFDYCFNNTMYDNSMAPKLRLHFGEGAVFEPPVKSYILTVVPGITCLGIVPIPFPGTNIIGNILQQNHLWQFDFNNNTVSFTPSECV